MNSLYSIMIIFLIVFVGCESSNLVDPATTLQYSIEEKSHVKLSVENSYNTVVKALVDTVQSAGMYSVSFDSSNLAEGVYFYTVEARGVDSDYYYKLTQHFLMVKL